MIHVARLLCLYQFSLQFLIRKGSILLLQGPKAWATLPPLPRKPKSTPSHDCNPFGSGQSGKQFSVRIIARSEPRAETNPPHQSLHFVFGASSHVNTASLASSIPILPQTLAAVFPQYSWLVVASPSATSLPSSEMGIPAFPQMSTLAQNPSSPQNSLNASRAGIVPVWASKANRFLQPSDVIFYRSISSNIACSSLTASTITA